MNWAGMIYLVRAVTPIHPGAGESIIEASDLPIQRNRLGVPIIDGSSLKGSIRSRLKSKNDEELIKLLFGSKPEETHIESGSIAILDALPLLIPVRSLFGGWAYITSPWLLFTFSNKLDIMGDDLRDASKIVTALALDSLGLGSSEAMAPETLTENIDGEDVVVLLDEYIFKRKEPKESFNLFVEMLLGGSIGRTLKDRLVIVSDEIVRLFLTRGMRIQQRVKLTSDKTVEHGPWGEEQIPPDTIMYLSFLCSESRVKIKKEKLLNLIKQAGSATIDKEGNVNLRPEELRNVLKNLLGNILLFAVGGDESVGRGVIEIQEFEANKDVRKKDLRIPDQIKMLKSNDIELKAHISDKERLSDIYQRIQKRIPKKNKDYIKELQSLPTLLVQCGIQPTYFYYKHKGEKDEENKRERWVWEELNNRVYKLLGKDLKKDEILNPLRLMLLEWDIMKFITYLKRISNIFRGSGRVA